MLLRQSKPTADTAPSRALREHLLDQQFTRLLIDCPGPTLSADMNVLDLLFGQQINTLTGSIEPLRQVVARFLFSVRLKLDRVITLLATCQRFQPRQQILLGKQKDMWAPFGISRSKCQDAFQCRVIQLISIVDQQIDLLPGQRQLPYLRQNRTHIGLSNGQSLSDLAQQGLATGDTLRNDNALHRLLVGTGDQRLTQQGLATAFRADYRQQQLAVTRQVMQLTQHRFSLRWKELKSGHSWRKGVVTELVMRQESFVSMQTGHGSLFKSWTTEPALRSRYAAWRREFHAGNRQSLQPHPNV